MVKTVQRTDSELQLGILEIIAAHEGASLGDLVPAISNFFGLPEIVLAEREELWMITPVRILRSLLEEWFIHCTVRDEHHRSIASKISWHERNFTFLELTSRGVGYLRDGQVPLSQYSTKQSRQRITTQPDNSSKHSRGIREVIIEKERSYRRPQNSDEAIGKIAAAIATRRGQKEFRQALLNIYGRQCLITGPCIEDILEAAHVKPYSEGGTFHISNGLLLRTDIHTLFDLSFIAIDPKTMTVVITKELQSTSYNSLAGRNLLSPVNRESILDKVALEERLQLLQSKL